MSNNSLTALIPKKITDLVGHEKLINSNNGLIYKMIEKKYLLSLIISGPSGIGKSSILNVLSISFPEIPSFIFNAAIDNKKKLNDILHNSNEQKIIIIIEEINRMNRDKQDILLDYIQANKIVLFASTTENPYFSIITALRSRCTIINLDKLTMNDIAQGIKKFLSLEKNKESYHFFSNKIIKNIATISQGDLRKALSIIETILMLFPNQLVTTKLLKTLNYQPDLQNFKTNEYHHDLKSAMQKSIRGSDVDASLYYFMQLLLSGDIESLLRRMLIIAYEDIGLANPNIVTHVKLAIDSFRELGMPEGKIPLGLAIIEMALSQKSNSVANAVKLTSDSINKGQIYSMPKYLQSNNFKTNEKYLYPHLYPYNYIEQQYLPDELINIKYYHPNLYNLYEKKINQLYNEFKNK